MADDLSAGPANPAGRAGPAVHKASICACDGADRRMVSGAEAGPDLSPGRSDRCSVIGRRPSRRCTGQHSRDRQRLGVSTERWATGPFRIVWRSPLWARRPDPVPEDVLPLPESPYGIAKYCAEQYLGLYNRLHGTRHAALRLANVYGPRQDPGGDAGVIRLSAGPRWPA